MHDPCTLVGDFQIRGHRIVTVWHKDPETDGSDNSCDWFGGRHVDKDIVHKVASSFAYQMKNGMYGGWFKEGGLGRPNFSPMAIGIAMFHIASGNMMGFWKRRQRRFMADNLLDILHFAENNCDSLIGDMVRGVPVDEQKSIRCERCNGNGYREESGYGEENEKPTECYTCDGTGMVKDPDQVYKRAREFAGVVCSWVARRNRPWYRHPRWHFWHWQVQFPILWEVRSWLFAIADHVRRWLFGPAS